MRLLLVAAAAVLSITLTAHADTVITYQGANYTQASGSFNTSEAVSGTLTVAGSFAPNLTGTTQIFPTAYTFTDGIHQYVLGQPLNQGYLFPYTDAMGNLVSLYAQLTLFVPTTYLNDYLNIQYGPDLFGQNGDFIYTANGFASSSSDGRLTVTTTHAAVTPEPSSIFLLGTGVLGMAGAFRRRFAQAARIA